MPNEILKLIADNPRLIEALKTTLLKQFELEANTDGMDDLQLGQMMRARLIGRQKIEDAFKEIAKFKSFETVKKAENPAY